MPHTGRSLAEFLLKNCPDAVVKIHSFEEPACGLVDIALIYNDKECEILEDMDSPLDDKG